MKKYINKLLYSGVKLLAAALLFQSCDKDDPQPVHEEEVITTVQITLAPEGGGIPVTLKFFDADGELGSIAPLISVSGHLEANTVYGAIIELANETVNPVGDITEEVAAEADDHLFCFAVNGNIAIEYEDEDDHGLPLGLITSWTTSEPGDEKVTVTLRHQPGTKTGDCPGSGETDIEVTFDLQVE
jgi:hypothetical protein